MRSTPARATCGSGRSRSTSRSTRTTSRPKPASLTLHEAAAVPLVSLAAWQALVDRAHGQPGQKVLVHAGSGGLGSTVIQLAKHLGATVATTASGENGELVRRLRRRRPRGLQEAGLRRS